MRILLMPIQIFLPIFSFINPDKKPGRRTQRAELLYSKVMELVTHPLPTVYKSSTCNATLHAYL